MRTFLAGALGTAALAWAPAALAAGPEGPPERPDTHQVMFVGNNWDGTADIVDARTFQRLGRINTIPDREERTQEILANPAKAGFFLAIRQQVGEGNDQFTDDMFTSHDGRFVYVSRPSFADVVGIEIATGKIVWRFPMEGYRADHMAISPDGRSLLVSDSTANKVHRLDTADRAQDRRVRLGRLAAREQLHAGRQSDLPRKHRPGLYADRPAELGPIRDSSKGARYFQIVDGHSLALIKRWDMGQKLAEFGRPDMESAVRPMAIAPGEKQVYAQISFHHGFVEFDVPSERVLRVADLPLSEKAKATPHEEYLLDSAHHGLAMNAEGTKLCVAGTMSDYAAIVSRADLRLQALHGHRREAVLVDQRAERHLLGVGQRQRSCRGPRLRDRARARARAGGRSSPARAPRGGQPRVPAGPAPAAGVPRPPRPAHRGAEQAPPLPAPQLPHPRANHRAVGAALRRRAPRIPAAAPHASQELQCPRPGARAAPRHPPPALPRDRRGGQPGAADRAVPALRLVVRIPRK